VCDLNGLEKLITATFWSSKQNGEWKHYSTKLDSNKRKSLQGSLINNIPSFESNQTLWIDARSLFTTIPYVTVATKEMFKLDWQALPYPAYSSEVAPSNFSFIQIDAARSI